MRNITKRVVAAGMDLVMMAGMLTGCGGDGNDNDGSGGAKSNGKTITVYAQRNGLGDTWLPNAAKAYTKKTGTKVNVEYDAFLSENLTTMLESESVEVADLYCVQTYEWGRWTYNDHLVDLTEFMNEKDENGRSLNERMKTVMRYVPDNEGNKKQTTVPFTMGVSGYAYNIEMMNYLCHDVLGWADGHDYPVNTKELNEVMDALEQVTAEGSKKELFTYEQNGRTMDVKPFVWSGTVGMLGATSLTWIYQYLGEEGMEKFFTQYENCDMYNDEAFYIVYQAIVDLMRLEEDSNGDYISTTAIPNCVSYNHTQSQSQILMGKALMCPTGSWFYSEMSATIEDETAWGFMPIPYLSDEEGNPITGEGVEMPREADGTYANYVRVNDPGDYFCISKRSRNQEEAKEFLKFIFSEEYIANLQTDTQSLLCYEFEAEAERSVWLDRVIEMTDGAVFADTFTGSKMQIFGNIQFYYNPYGVKPYALLSQSAYGSSKVLIDSATGKTISSAEQATGVAVTENVYKYVHGNYNGVQRNWNEAVRKVERL